MCKQQQMVTLQSRWLLVKLGRKRDEQVVWQTLPSLLISLAFTQGKPG